MHLDAIGENPIYAKLPIYEVDFNSINESHVIFPDFEYIPYTVMKEAVDRAYPEGRTPTKTRKKYADKREKKLRDKRDKERPSSNYGAPSIMGDPKAMEILEYFLEWSFKNPELFEDYTGTPFYENGEISSGLPVIVLGAIPSNKRNVVDPKDYKMTPTVRFSKSSLRKNKAINNLLSQIDVKSKVQQAKVDFVKGDPQVVKLLEESSMNDVKDVDRLTRPGTYNNVKFSKNHRAEYEKTISKNRPDLVKEGLVSKTVDSMFDFIDNLDVTADKKRKYERITTKWLATSNVKLGEDSYKIQQAVELAEKHNKDIFSYNNPNEIIEAYAGKSKAEPTNPKNVKEFGEGRVFNKKHGITVYEVEDTEEGMMAVRKVADMHWGPKSNPWCIIARSEKQRVEPRQYGYESVATKSDAQARKQQLESEGFIVEIRPHSQVKNGLRYELDIKEVKEGPGIMEGAWQSWTAYDKSKKYIVFQNGRLSSFYADDQYWDRMDNPTDAPVVQIKEGRVTRKVELVPYTKDGVTKIEEFVRETRTVSKDKKTVTTEYHAEQFLVAGDYKVEDRVNGITVKETDYRADGTKYGETTFKNGKAISSVTFTQDGMTKAINRYGTPFGDMSVDDIVKKKGDLLSHEMRDDGFDYYHGDILFNGKRIEIGWQAKEGTFDLKNAIETVDGKVRADLKKLLEVDPNVKGLPKGNIMFSKSMNQNFNDILENVTSIESKKRFSEIKGRKRGASKGKFRLFIPPSHEDFVGLLYNFMGKGREGDKHRDFFEQALVRPINRAYIEIDAAKQAIADNYKALNKKFPEIKDKLIKTTPDGDFTFSDAIRVYLWNKHGHKIPGLSKTDQAKLTELVQSDPQLQAYAETLNMISKQETYVAPGQSWDMGNIRIDLVDATGRVGRAEYFAEYQENAEIIFSEENLNKIEAAYGKDFRSALEDMLHRIKTGVNRPKGASAKPNMFMNWLNASVAGVMFFNTRSALLQQMSNVNYLNFADNNIYAAGKAFANQPQYWKDFAMIFNSDMLKQRRGGLGTDINGAELAEAIKKARPDSIFDQVAIITGKALKLGFLPTQIGDNIAIATGGAAFYRNRVNTYLKQGMSIKEAESKAFTDFQNITQSTQQSARPDMTSQQQASWMGKLVLNFLNTSSQYNRIIKKAALDIKNRRITGPNTTQAQSDMSNLSRMLYYGAVQNLIFYTLQTALFAVMFGDDEDEEAYLTKKERVINSGIDTLLRGSGIYGVAISTLKNMTIKFIEQREKGYNWDESAVLMEGLNFSPVLGIKARGIVDAEKTLNYNMPVIKEMELFDIDNPIWSASTNIVQSITGAPVNRTHQKIINLRNATDNQYTAFQRAMFLSGYTTWSMNLGDTDKMKKIKETVKIQKKEESKQKAKDKRKNKGRGKRR